MGTIKTIDRPQNHVRLGCHDCRRFHDFVVPCDDPDRLLRELDSWDYKHFGHDKPFPVFLKRDIPRDYNDSHFDKLGHGPWWHPASGYRENNNFQTAYVASAGLTITSWATLASDSNLLAGASSAFVDNGATGAPLEIAISAQIKNGTTPTTGKEIDLYAWAVLDDTPTYPDAITGSDALITISTATAINEALSQITSMQSTTTTGAAYPTGWHTVLPKALSPLFGGFLPRRWGLFIVHNTVAAFVTGHVATQKGLYVAG
jgi:hypothetical protein